MSSPGIGLQHFDKEYSISSFLPSNSINLSLFISDFLTVLDLSISISMILFLDLLLTFLTWSRYSFNLLRLKEPLAIS